MNFLAHVYLSGENNDIMIGNFIADHVKGNDIDDFRMEISRGIKLHRMIDDYTDHHPIFNQSKQRLSSTYRHYSGVLVDMFYDHFLAANWKDYCSENLYVYTRKKYRILMKNFLILPSETKKMLPFMMSTNWLASYKKLDFLQRALSGMAIRTPFKSGMENAVSDLKDDYDLYQAEFRSFFDEMMKFVQDEEGIILSQKISRQVETPDNRE